MNKRIMFAAAAVPLLGIAVLTAKYNGGTVPPADLRDAVADNSAIGDLRGATDAQDITVPAPAVEAVYAEPGAEAAFGIRSKGFNWEKFPGEDYSKSAAGGDLSAQDKGVEKAMADLRDIPGATLEEKLKNLFESGVPATDAQLKGWKSGRYVNNKGKIVGVLSLGRSIRVQTAPDGGPLAPAQHSLEFTVHMFVDSNPAWFDNMSPGDVEDVKETMERHSVFHKSGEGKFIFKSSGIVLTEEFRIAGGYIVDKFIDSRDSGREFYGYHFKDVTPKK